MLIIKLEITLHQSLMSQAWLLILKWMHMLLCIINIYYIFI